MSYLKLVNGSIIYFTEHDYDTKYNYQAKGWLCMDWEVQCPECDEFWVKCPCCGIMFCPNCFMTLEEAEEMALSSEE